MRSMTGYGRAVVERDGRRLTIELKSVNHRFLDLSMRMPRAFNFLEDTARKKLGEALSRGHVDLFASYQNSRDDGKTVKIDEALLAAYARALDDIEASTGLKDDRTLTRLAFQDGVITLAEADEDEGALKAIFADALSVAAASLNEMRAREGEFIKADLLSRVAALRGMLASIKERYPATLTEYEGRLRERVAELLGDKAVDEQRLLQEVALMADRSAIDEETVRLDSHFEQFEALCAANGPVGRKLDFLVQELNREVNTISSKSQDVPITRLVVEAKAEIEKLREQVQNVE